MQPDNCFNTRSGYNGFILLNFNQKGENTMRNILGTEKGRIILPKMKCNSEIFSKFSRRWTSTAEMGENGERGTEGCWRE